MLPQFSNDIDLDEEYEVIPEPDKTYRLNEKRNIISGTIEDGLEAVRQSIYKILKTERYEYIMYSWDYGIELENLFGKPIEYVLPELEDRIIEALRQDDRVDNVADFRYTVEGRKVFVKFKVYSIYGVLKEEMEVEI